MAMRARTAGRWARAVALAGTGLVLSTAPVRAQGDTVTTTTTHEEEDRDFPWGLLGLLGLAGLLGRRREPEMVHTRTDRVHTHTTHDPGPGTTRP